VDCKRWINATGVATYGQTGGAAWIGRTQHMQRYVPFRLGCTVGREQVSSRILLSVGVCFGVTRHSTRRLNFGGADAICRLTAHGCG
jgi:hypothetical protein